MVLMPMVNAMCINFSHVIHLFLTSKTIQCIRSQLQSFPPFWIGFYSALTVSGELKLGWAAGAGGAWARWFFFKIEMGKHGMPHFWPL